MAYIWKDIQLVTFIAPKEGNRAEDGNSCLEEGDLLSTKYPFACKLMQQKKKSRLKSNSLNNSDLPTTLPFPSLEANKA